MSFTQFLQSIYTIILNCISWLGTTFNILYQQYTFKILFFLTIFIVLIHLFIKIYNSIFVNKKLIYNEDFYDNEDFEETDFEETDFEEEEEDKNIWV